MYTKASGQLEQQNVNQVMWNAGVDGGKFVGGTISGTLQE